MHYNNRRVLDIYTLQLVKHITLVAALLLSSSAAAHEMTPTYPEARQSWIEGVKVVDMKLWNRRNDAEWYEINVFDAEWNPLPFAASDRIIKVEHLEQKTFQVYIREIDLSRVEFICTQSKQLREDVQSTGIMSRICSRLR